MKIPIKRFEPKREAENEFQNSPVPKTPKTPKTQPFEAINSSSGGFGGFGGGGEDENDSWDFPTQLLPPILQQMTSEVSRVALVPESLAAMNALGFISSSLGGGLLIDSGGGLITPPNLFLLGIAESGTGKGRAFSLASKSFSLIEAEEIEYWETNGFPELRKDQRLVEKDLKKLEKCYERQDDATGRQQIGLEIQEIEAKKAELEKALAREPGFSVADITKEKLAVSLEQQPGQALASLSPEGRGVIDVLMGKYGKGGDSDEDLYLSAYSRERVKVSRINRPPVNLKTPCLSVLWLIQPDKARRLTESEAITESGLLPRFLICDSKAEAMDEPENPTGICHATIEKWDNLIRDLIETFRAKGNNPVTINADTNARRVIVDFKNENNARTRKGGDLKDITPFVARWAENAWRLALVFHAAKHGSEAGKHNLSHHTADKAVAIVRWFCQEQLSILAPKRNDRNRERLLKLISVLKDHEGTRTLRDLHKSNGFTNEEVEKLAEVFPKQIQVETIKPEKGGRPSKVANLI